MGAASRAVMAVVNFFAGPFMVDAETGRALMGMCEDCGTWRCPDCAHLISVIGDHASWCPRRCLPDLGGRR